MEVDRAIAWLLFWGWRYATGCVHTSNVRFSCPDVSGQSLISSDYIHIALFLLMPPLAGRRQTTGYTEIRQEYFWKASRITGPKLSLLQTPLPQERRLTHFPTSLLRRKIAALLRLRL